MYREIIAVCSEPHTKHTNTMCWQNVEFVNVKIGGTVHKATPKEKTVRVWSTSDREPVVGMGPPASHRGDSGSIPDQSIWVMWWAQWHRHRFFAQYIGSPVTESLHRCSTFISSHCTYHKDMSAKLGTLTQGNAVSISDSTAQHRNVLSHYFRALQSSLQPEAYLFPSLSKWQQLSKPKVSC
jgi:hypothetical protein